MQDDDRLYFRDVDYPEAPLVDLRESKSDIRQFREGVQGMIRLLVDSIERRYER